MDKPPWIANDVLQYGGRAPEWVLKLRFLVIYFR